MSIGINVLLLLICHQESNNFVDVFFSYNPLIVPGHQKNMSIKELKLAAEHNIGIKSNSADI